MLVSEDLFVRSDLDLQFLSGRQEPGQRLSQTGGFQLRADVAARLNLDRPQAPPPPTACSFDLRRHLITS